MYFNFKHSFLIETPVNTGLLNVLVNNFSCKNSYNLHYGNPILFSKIRVFDRLGSEYINKIRYFKVLTLENINKHNNCGIFQKKSFQRALSKFIVFFITKTNIFLCYTNYKIQAMPP